MSAWYSATLFVAMPMRLAHRRETARRIDGRRRARPRRSPAGPGFPRDRRRKTGRPIPGRARSSRVGTRMAPQLSQWATPPSGPPGGCGRPRSRDREAAALAGVADEPGHAGAVVAAARIRRSREQVGRRSPPPPRPRASALGASSASMTASCSASAARAAFASASADSTRPARAADLGVERLLALHELELAVVERALCRRELLDVGLHRLQLAGELIVPEYMVFSTSLTGPVTRDASSSSRLTSRATSSRRPRASASGGSSARPRPPRGPAPRARGGSPAGAAGPRRPVVLLDHEELLERRRHRAAQRISRRTATPPPVPAHGHGAAGAVGVAVAGAVVGVVTGRSARSSARPGAEELVVPTRAADVRRPLLPSALRLHAARLRPQLLVGRDERHFGWTGEHERHELLPDQRRLGAAEDPDAADWRMPWAASDAAGRPSTRPRRAAGV